MESERIQKKTLPDIRFSVILYEVNEYVRDEGVISGIAMTLFSDIGNIYWRKKYNMM